MYGLVGYGQQGMVGAVRLMVHHAVYERQQVGFHGRDNGTASGNDRKQQEKYMFSH
jgi:hypothetical protein